MNKLFILVIVAMSFAACTQNGMVIDTEKSTELSTELDSVSYLLGVNVATDLRDNGGLTKIDNKSFLTGMQRIFEEKEIEINENDARTFMQAYFTKLKKEKGEASLAEGNEFLEENKAKEGVKVTETGLQYRVITEGDGPIPTREDKVRVHYTGKLVDGTVFDSSVERGEPTEFPANRVIPGWTEALTMMPVGSKWELVIPAELGYGERGSGPIPGNSTLIFEVELLDIVKGEE